MRYVVLRTYPRATGEPLSEGVVHRCSQYLSNRIEQHHRGSKGCYQPMPRFGSSGSAARLYAAHDGLRGYLRHRSRMHEVVPLDPQREQSRARSVGLRTML